MLPCSTQFWFFQIFAYAVSYDWSRGHEYHNPQKKNYIYLRSCFEDLKPRTKS